MMWLAVRRALRDTGWLLDYVTRHWSLNAKGDAHLGFMTTDGETIDVQLCGDKTYINVESVSRERLENTMTQVLAALKEHKDE